MHTQYILNVIPCIVSSMRTKASFRAYYIQDNVMPCIISIMQYMLNVIPCTLSISCLWAQVNCFEHSLNGLSHLKDFVKYPPKIFTAYFLPSRHRLNMELDLLNLFGLGPRNPPPTPEFGLIYEVVIVSQDRRHLYVNPCFALMVFKNLAIA
jgi:hypothetical protein